MKKNKSQIYLFLLCLLVGIFLGFGISDYLKTSDSNSAKSKKISTDSISSVEMLKDLDIKKAIPLIFKDSNARFIVYAYAPKDKDGNDLIEIFKNSNGNLESIYKFQPVAPKDLYPNPLMFENIWRIKKASSRNDSPESMALVTSWGETGADYFGSHPIVIEFINGKFQVDNFYKGNLSEDPRIKDYEWTSKDFEVKNYYDEDKSVKTILTQGISVTDDKINLRFIGDNECKACEHKYVNLDFYVN